jgi:hypothetical protein
MAEVAAALRLENPTAQKNDVSKPEPSNDSQSGDTSNFKVKVGIN